MPPTLLCLVTLNLLTRPPVRPAAATQFPQLLRQAGAREEGGGPALLVWWMAGPPKSDPWQRLHGAAPPTLGPAPHCQNTRPPAHPCPARQQRRPPAHIVVEQQRLKPVCPPPPVQPQVEGQEGSDVLTPPVGHEACRWWVWGGGWLHAGPQLRRQQQGGQQGGSCMGAAAAGGKQGGCFGGGRPASARLWPPAPACWHPPAAIPWCPPSTA